MNCRFAAVALVLACVAGSAARAAFHDSQRGDQPVFSTRVEAVRVDVLVTQQNHSVPGLTADDFELRDNGIVQRLEVVDLERMPLNLVLAFDLSESVKGSRIEELRQAGAALLDALKPDDRVALITFSHVVALRCRLAVSTACARAALAGAMPHGRTSLIDGAYAALTLGESDDGRSLVMIFSDRFDTGSWLSPASVVETSKQSDAVVYGIQPPRRHSPFLYDLTAATGGRLLEPAPGRDLTTTFLGILEEFRQRYVLTYTPAGVAPGGWHTLRVRVRRAGVAVRARPGYLSMR
jgi:VWFA-related protein